MNVLSGATVAVPLDHPPEVVSIGVGRHGTTRRVDVFRLPDLWSLHLYNYSADLVVDRITYAIRPGTVSLVPAGAQSQYRYRGASEHLYAHVRLTESGNRRVVPLLQPAGIEAPALAEQLRQALAASTLPHAPTPRYGPRCGGSPNWRKCRNGPPGTRWSRGLWRTSSPDSPSI